MTHSDRHRRLVSAPMAGERCTTLFDFSGRISVQPVTNEILNKFTKNGYRLDGQTYHENCFSGGIRVSFDEKILRQAICVHSELPTDAETSNKIHSRWHFKPNHVNGVKLRFPQFINAQLCFVSNSPCFMSLSSGFNWMHTSSTHANGTYSNSRRQNDRWLTHRHTYVLPPTTATRQPHTCLIYIFNWHQHSFRLFNFSVNNYLSTETVWFTF